MSNKEELKKDDSKDSIIGKLLSMAHDLLHMSTSEPEEVDGVVVDSIMMSEEGGEEIYKSIDSVIIKSDEEKRLVTGVVMVPDEEDTHGDAFDAPQIETAAYQFMEEYQEIGIQHAGTTYSVSIVESYISRDESEIGGQKILKGSWVMTVKVHSDSLWSAVKAGTFTGFSIGGYATRV